MAEMIKRSPEVEFVTEVAPSSSPRHRVPEEARPGTVEEAAAELHRAARKNELEVAERLLGGTGTRCYTFLLIQWNVRIFASLCPSKFDAKIRLMQISVEL